MNLRPIACDALVGLPRKPFEAFTPTAADFDAELKRLKIAAAIVRHRGCTENDPYWANDQLLEEAKGRPSWRPALCLTPDGRAPEHDFGRYLRAQLRRGIRAFWISPKEHQFSVLPWCAGPLYAEMQARRIPLLLDYKQATLDELDQVLTAFPQLRLVLLNVPRLGRHRGLYALLGRHTSLHLCLNYTYSVHAGWDDLIRSFGSERFVWGSGYPESEGGASLMPLLYEPLAPENRTALARGNIERLLAEVDHA